MNNIPSIAQLGPQSLFNNTGNSSLGKDDFLKILVTQLQNQDPVNPVNGDQLAAQLAQFSSVEQLQNINTTLSNTSDQNLLLNQAINNTMATTLIGKTVRAFGDAIQNNGELHYQLSDSAHQVAIQITDGSGEIVRTVKLDEQSAGDQVYKWDGKDDAGNHLRSGNYSFNVKAEDVNGDAVTSQTYVVGPISSVQYENGNAVLRIGDLKIPLSEVVEIGSE